MTQKILVTGITGQVGRELMDAAKWPDGFTVIGVDRSGLDITDPAAVSDVLRAERPAAVINPAAYTAVDGAETDADTAWRVNRDGPRHLAEVAAAEGIALFQVSTDYVFDGSKPGAYSETDPVAPLGVYGRSKEAGEAAIRAVLDRHVILRTAWVFSAHGGNFVKTMLRLARTRDALSVVDDQIGGPTAAAEIARALITLTAHNLSGRTARWGTYHFAGAPAVSWCGFAQAIFDAALPPDARPTLSAIPSRDYPTPARRPANSVLNCTKIFRDFGITQPDWHTGLNAVLAALAAAQTNEDPS